MLTTAGNWSGKKAAPGRKGKSDVDFSRTKGRSVLCYLIFRNIKAGDSRNVLGITSTAAALPPSP